MLTLCDKEKAQRHMYFCCYCTQKKSPQFQTQLQQRFCQYIEQYFYLLGCFSYRSVPYPPPRSCTHTNTHFFARFLCLCKYPQYILYPAFKILSLPHRWISFRAYLPYMSICTRICICVCACSCKYIKIFMKYLHVHTYIHCMYACTKMHMYVCIKSTFNHYQNQLWAQLRRELHMCER